MFELVAPNVSFHQSFLEAHREWGGTHQDGAGLFPNDDVSTPEGFAAWVQRLADAEHAPEKARVLLERQVLVGHVGRVHRIGRTHRKTTARQPMLAFTLAMTTQRLRASHS